MSPEPRMRNMAGPEVIPEINELALRWRKYKGGEVVDWGRGGEDEEVTNEEMDS